MFNQNNQTTNYNNVDIRCGLLMSVRVNCNYIISLYQDYNSEGSYEFTYIGNPKYEEQSTEAFWDEYNTMIANVLAEPHKYREENGGMEQELIYKFEECLHIWKANFTMENEEIETEDEESECEDCDCENEEHLVGLSFLMNVGDKKEKDEESDTDEEGHTCELCMEVEGKDEVENGGDWVFNEEDGVWNCGECCMTNVDSELRIEEVELTN